MFAVILTGAPGAGKTATLLTLTDALIDDAVALAAGDVDDLAWAYPYPDLAGRCDHLRAWAAAHREAGQDTFAVAEVIESDAHLADVLAAIGTEDHLLVRLAAPVATMRERIVAREPVGWSGLERLLGEVEPLDSGLAELNGVHLTIDTAELELAEVVERIRSARPDRLRPTR